MACVFKKNKVCVPKKIKRFVCITSDKVCASNFKSLFSSKATLQHKQIKYKSKNLNQIRLYFVFELRLFMQVLCSRGYKNEP